MPALATAPVTVVPVIRIEVVAWPAGFATLACGVVMFCPALAGAAPSRSAVTQVLASNGEATRRGSNGNFGTKGPLVV
ncbi:MAG: hypothetical protein JOY97_12625 [Hyphomicrobiales bacterium]|nr:hypothetical protein [Hyphomicrobiales bacterium]